MDQLLPQKKVEFLKLKIKEAYALYTESDMSDKPGPLDKEYSLVEQPFALRNEIFGKISVRSSDTTHHGPTSGRPQQ